MSVPGEGTTALWLQLAVTNMDQLGARSQQASLWRPIQALLTPAVVAPPDDKVFWIFVKVLLTYRSCFTSFQPNKHFFPKSSFCQVHPTPQSAGTELDRGARCHSASSRERPRPPLPGGCHRLGSGSIPAAVQRAATEILHADLHAAVTGTTDAPMGRTT